ncbi:MAG: phenylalanine--tRNA ligase subunit beta [Gemmatimonadales bacterium]|nr:phenylalanine--tRNA ligase subunit beta [Gemmatimonadales bacterium]
MKASRRWLEAFLRRPLDPADVAERLGMLGAPVDAVESLGADLGQFVVARVTDVRPHPDADKLRVTTVDDGSGTLWNVVCGAPNVVAGGKYPFARLGTTMPGGMVIERRKLRGQPSEGMLCSARELGLGTEHDGLLTLETDAAPGTPLTEVVGGGDHRFEIDVTPNRPDLLGHKGIARELALSFRVPYRLPPIPDEATADIPPPVRAGDEATVGGVGLRIIDRGCGRFLGAVVRGVTVGPSPAWLVERLQGAGVRSINNVVDVTNYLLLELNQPMHAYDAATLRGPAVIVRSATAGESLVTLDGVSRTLREGMLVIADAERVIGIAGVMGGEATEVSDSTTDLFLECAWFEPSRVRRARRAVGLSTDASHRFERGTDRWGALDAFQRALRLLLTVAGGRIDGATVDCQPTQVHPPRIFLRPARVAQVLGVDLAWTEIERCLVGIGATVVSKPDDGRIAVDVPGWRPDLLAEIDLIEEIARVHGYDNIPSELRPFRPGLRVDDPAWTAAARVRAGMTALGLSEVMTLPMVAAAGDQAPRVLNPLSAEHGVLRDALIPSLLRQVEANWANQTGNIRLYEIGTVFTANGAKARPSERLAAAFVISGDRHPAHWSEASQTARYDRWDARGISERLVALANPGASVQVEQDRWIFRNAVGEQVGWCGMVTADAPPWAAPVFAGEITIAPGAVPTVGYQPLPVYPASVRDLALLVGLDQQIADATTLLLERGRRHDLVAVAVVDEYRGAGLPERRRSVTVRLTFRAADRTLTDADVDRAVGRLCTSLERELDITLRSA